MHALDSFLPDPVPASWALTDDQRHLCATCQRFAREQLEPLLAQSPTASAWRDTVKLAATLDLGTMILPEDRGGMAIDRHDLALVVATLAAGPLERTAELTLSAPALMAMRAHDVLDPLSVYPIPEYFDGTTSIALSVPDIQTGTIWRLRPRSGAQGFTMTIHGDQNLVLAKRTDNPRPSGSGHLAMLGDLLLERLGLDEVSAEPPLIVPRQPDRDGTSLAQTWMTEAGLYLSALLIGAMQHSVAFALDYATTRQAFRKPLATHQLVATRLADMLMATHSTHLFLRAVAAAHSPVPLALMRQLMRHVAAESVDVSRELVQLCGGHGYVEGLPPAARFQTSHWFAWLLMRIDAALERFTARQPEKHPGASA